jgi:CheY-like chemotaxis protein
MKGVLAMPKIVIVDDNQELLTAYRVLLPAKGFEVLTAPNGLTGLEVVAEHGASIACAVIDVRMPELNGFQLVQALRGDPATAHLPLILLTAMTRAIDRQQGALVGADYYLTKPVDPEDLLATIEQATRLTPEQRHHHLQEVAHHLDNKGA